MTHRSLLLHPFVIFSSVWLGIIGLFVLRLSKVLNASNEDITYALDLILIPYALALAASAFFYFLVPKIWASRKHLLCGVQEHNEELLFLKKRLKRWACIWIVLSVAEIFASGGVPLVWLFTGSSKTYFDFGIQTLHGLLNSMVLSIALCFAGIFAKSGDRRYLLAPLGVVAWALLLVTRSMIIVNLIQTSMIIVLYQGIPRKLIFKLIAGALIIVVGFGALGDLRTGAVNFRTLAQPTEAYPEWLPSGVLWVYIYVTTPLNNLAHTITSVRPINNPLFPNTAAPLFPGIIRGAIYGDSLATSLSGELVDSNFNVSTAYIGPFQDYGAIGIVLFSFSIALFAAFYWRRHNFRDELIYIVVGQCLVTTIFYNHFFSLPIISQIIWIYLFFLPSKKSSGNTTASLQNISSCRQTSGTVELC